MNFSSLLKGVNLNNYKIEYVNTNLIQAQYNPTRFKYWKSLHKGPEKEVLNMLYSPHYRFLKLYKINSISPIEKTSYYKMHKLYGKNNKWIKDKINKFINLFEDIKKEGCKEPIIILSKPLVENIYNKNFEIYEGHHRFSIFLTLREETIKCKII